MTIFAINYQELHRDFLGTRQIDGQFRVPCSTQKEALAAFIQAQKDGGIERNATIIGIHEEQVPSRVFAMDFDVHPQSWQRAGTSTGHFYTQKATREFEDEMKLLMRSQMDGDLITTGCEVTLVMLFACKDKKKWGTPKVTRPDNDNHEKSIFDAGNGIVWADDCLIWHNDTKKYWAETDHIHMEVSAE
jgi:Holliday junction resolvase RusA-like endonuclease